MNRELQPEWLDELPPRAAAARRSRRDLRRLNRIMGHVGHVQRALMKCSRQGFRPEWLIDLGAGDGWFACNLSRSLANAQEWRGIGIVVVDRLMAIDPSARSAAERAGVRWEAVQAEVHPWLAEATRLPGEALVANLFLHHLEEERLRELFALAASRAAVVVACEPRRAPFVLWASRLVGCLGCNGVTRHDAVASVRAGFRERDLTRLWTERRGWRLNESRAGLFSHLFVARKEA